MKIFIFIILFVFSIYPDGFRRIHKEHVTYESPQSFKKSYKSYLSNEMFLKKISHEYDFISYLSLGRTHYGLEIPAIKMSHENKKDKVNLLFNCAHHSNELISTEHCYDIIYKIINDQDRNYLELVSIWIIPIVNPDGSKLFWDDSTWKGRKNGREVDLNRNYPFMWGVGQGSSSDQNHEFYRGTHSLSEIESDIISKLGFENNFLFSVSYHSKGKKLLIPYTINNIINPSEDYPKFFGEKIAKQIGYAPIKNLYPVNGTDQDYLYFKYGTIAFLLESEKNNPAYSDVDNIVSKTEKLWREIIRESIYGNKIFLKVINEKGNPLSARIEIEDIKYYNGEEYYSSPSGIFNRMVLKDQYTITISHQNYVTQKILINSTKNNEITLIKMKSY